MGKGRFGEESVVDKVMSLSSDDGVLAGPEKG